MTYPEEWDGPHELPPELASWGEPQPDPDPEPDGPWDDSAMPGPELDEHTALAVALVEGVFGDDCLGLAALLRYTEAPVLTSVCLTLAKLISEGMSPELIRTGAFRSWAAEAVRRD